MSITQIGPEFVTDSTTTPGARLSAAAVALRPGRCGKAWRDFNVDAARRDTSYGRFYQNLSNIGDLTSTQATAGTAAYIADTIAGGFSVLELDSNSTTNGQGIQVQYKGQGAYPRAGMVSYGHVRMRFKDIATGPEFFAGLATIDTSLIASDAMSATDWIGFLSLSGGTIKFGVDDGSTEDLSDSAIHTMVDGDTTTDGTEIVDLDWRWEVGSKLEVYVDGALADITGIDLANEPDGFIVPSIVLQTNGTTDPIGHVLESEFGFKYPK